MHACHCIHQNVRGCFTHLYQNNCGAKRIVCDAAVLTNIVQSFLKGDSVVTSEDHSSLFASFINVAKQGT